MTVFVSYAAVLAFVILPLMKGVGDRLDEPHHNLLVMTGVRICSAAIALPSGECRNMTVFT
ncbi:hypothetical protein AOQ84DRAFT_354876 [Glonium stellatum]|uniref:Uncharacterized protein n=1 Tax=Glonium stellatum TaxID=574774 RepID=A0A8E2JSC8_9PEZI|nr:hypothetical protein AOQ84DRAFT_354876 [Glonium stellatum]